MKKPINPCTPECGKRSASCKFDGTCTKWAPFEEKQKIYRDYMHNRRASMDVDRRRADRIMRQLGRTHTR